MRGPRRRDCSAPPMAARPGRASPASTRIPQRKAWCGGDQDGTPDGPKLHSILIDPRDRAHMYIGMSGGGVFESVDAGADWRPLNKGVRADFLPRPPIPNSATTRTACRFAGANPDRLYQQNHCGIYRLDRPSDTLAGHRRDDAEVGRRRRLSDGRCIRAIRTSLWVFPMDGTSVWPRMSPGGQARGLSLARRRQDVEAAGQRPAEVAGVVDGQAPGDDDRHARSDGTLFRDDVAARSGAVATKAAASGVSRGTCRTSTRSRRGADFAAHGRFVPANSERSLHCALSRRHAQAMTARASREAAVVVRVKIPSPLRSYTGAAEVTVAVPVLAPELPPTVGGVLAALDGALSGHPLPHHRRAAAAASPHQAVRRRHAHPRSRDAADRPRPR